MGFVRQRPNIKLRFESPQLEGLEVEVAPVNIDQFETIAKLANLALPEPGKPPTPEMVAEFVELCDRFGSALARWNLEQEDGTPVPANSDGLRQQDIPFVMALVLSWLDALEQFAAQLVSASIDETKLPQEVR